MAAETPKLLWNPDNVKDVAESVGIGSLNDEALKSLTQDVEYRIGQVIVEALRFMRASRRTTLTVNDISLALKALDVEPLYGYDSTRPLRYGEASLGPGQPLFYIEDEEVDFEKLINAPLPKVPRDMSFTGTLTSDPLRVFRRANLLLQRIGWPLKVFSPRSPRIQLPPNHDRKSSCPRVPVPTLPCPLWLATTMSP